MLLAVACLVAVGLACIYATGKNNEFNKQLFWLVIGLTAFIVANSVHYRRLGQISFFLFGASLFLLAVVLAGKYLHITKLVPAIGGSYRWIKLLPFDSESSIVSLARIQPSELAKLSYILALAWYLRHRKNYRDFKGLLEPFIITLAPMALIILEPDLGTVLLFLPVLFSMLFMAGARVRHLLTIMLIGASLSPLFYFTMKDYQRIRIVGLFRQSSEDPYWLRGNGYQLHQSKMCIGSGGVTGQGWRSGVFVKYGRFLPDRHNDFIFAMIGHQWGMLGCVFVLGLYVVVIICGIEIAANQVDPFGQLVAVGICTLLGAQMFINVGMTMGLMPVTGMTLPFVSYGGSSLLCNFLALGFLFNVARRRDRHIYRNDFEFED